MSYELECLITMFRQDMMDEAEPYLWSNVEITRYLAEAQDYFLENTGGIAATLAIPFSAADTQINIPSYVLRTRIAWDANERVINLENKVDWDVNYAGHTWRSETGIPHTLITDLESNTARLFPIPTDDGTMNIDIFRVAIESPEESEVMEVTDRNAQRVLLLGARSIGYRKEDPETLDENKAARYSLMFEAKTEDWYGRTQNSRRRARSVVYGGI